MGAVTCKSCRRAWSTTSRLKGPEALAFDDDDRLLHNNLAVIYLSTGRVERATAALERALDLGYDVPEQLRRAIADVRG